MSARSEEPIPYFNSAFVVFDAPCSINTAFLIMLANYLAFTMHLTFAGGILNKHTAS